MYIAQVKLDQFRNLSCSVNFTEGLAILIGENNIGKSNVIDALRMILIPDSGSWSPLSVRESDFSHDGAGAPVSNEFTISILFRGLSQQERAQMITCLAPSVGADAARITLRAERSSSRRPYVQWLGGDNGNPDIETLARNAVTYTYLPPLRDAAEDLRPGRNNRLVQLLSALAEGGPTQDAVVDVVKNANAALAGQPPIKSAKERIQERLDEMTGPGYRQVVDLAFSDPQFDRIVGSLRALVGPEKPFEMSESGLGFTNLLYMATLLAGLAVAKDSLLNVVLVEEPEAHLHPQLQDLLMRHLASASASGIQVIATTHSPNLASAAGVNHVTVLSRAAASVPVVARSNADFELSEDELGHLNRFLDVTKAALLFARRVLLVEGTAEQLLLPVIASRLGRPFPDAGVSVIDVGGLAFGPFAKLFGPTRLPYRCAIVSDADPKRPTAEGSEEHEGEQEEDAALSATAQKLLSNQNENLKVFLSERTLEWDIVATGNWDIALRALRRIHPRVANRLQKSYATADQQAQADSILDAIKEDKGRYSQSLVQELLQGGIFHAPPYIRDAIMWITDTGKPPPAPGSAPGIALGGSTVGSGK